MRSLKPSTIVVLGGLLTGAVMAAAFTVTTKEFRNPLGVSIAFGVGLVFGLLMVSPIAFAEIFGKGVQRWLLRHGARLQPVIGCAMLLALGYCLSSLRHQTFEALDLVAFAAVLLGAVFGIVVGIADRGHPCS